MSILDTLKEIKSEGFDAKKDKVSTNSKLDKGDYPVRLKSAQAGVSKKNIAQVALTLEVVSGKDKNRLEIIYLSFNDDLPEFVLAKNGRIILKIAAMVGVDFKNKDLEDEYAAAEALAKGIGQQFLMKLTIGANKNNPDFPYRNYEFEPLDDQPVDNSEVDEDDLPF